MILLKVLKFKLFDYCLNLVLNKLGENLTNPMLDDIRIGQVASRIEYKGDTFLNVKIVDVEKFTLFGDTTTALKISQKENQFQYIFLDNNTKIYY